MVGMAEVTNLMEIQETVGGMHGQWKIAMVECQHLDETGVSVVLV